MDPAQAFLLLALLFAAGWRDCGICGSVNADKTTESNILKALSGAGRYADRYDDTYNDRTAAGRAGHGDSYVADAWERAEDGWVRGGYTLVAADRRTEVQYFVDPLGELRVVSRAPGQPAQMRSFPPGSPLLGGYRPPFYERLEQGRHHFDDFDDPVEDDFFFFDDPDDWDGEGAGHTDVDHGLVDRWAALRGPARLRGDVCGSASVPGRGRARAKCANRGRGPASTLGRSAFNFAMHRVHS